MKIDIDEKPDDMPLEEWLWATGQTRKKKNIWNVEDDDTQEIYE